MNINRKKYSRFSLRFNRKESGNTKNCYTINNDGKLYNNCNNHHESNEKYEEQQHQNRLLLTQRSIDRCREIAANPEQFTELLGKGNSSSNV